MFTVEVSREEVEKDFPQVLDEQLYKIKKYFDKEIDEKDIELYYSYEFLAPDIQSGEIKNKEFEKNVKMMYDERIQHEMSNVKVNLDIEIGDFLLSDRVTGKTPEMISEIIEELTKIKMIYESDYHDNKDVKESIPELNDEVVSFEVIEDVSEEELKFYEQNKDKKVTKSSEFDIDSILDKIIKEGITSLTKEERDFLNKKSKDI